MPVKLGATPNDCVCKYHNAPSVDSGFCGVHDVAAGAAGTRIASVTDVVDLAGRVAGKGVDIVGATSLVMGASGPMPSG